MKALDHFLRAWRTHVAVNAAPKSMAAVLDVGCNDGYLLRRLDAAVREGIDPAIENSEESSGLRLHRGSFPADLARLSLVGPYDAIFALAVFEHLDEKDQGTVRDVLPNLLKLHGRLIVTVPHPFVDRILDMLLFFRLIDGQALHEHHGFDPAQLCSLASGQLRLVSRTSFQFGLNNLFVFEKVS